MYICNIQNRNESVPNVPYFTVLEKYIAASLSFVLFIAIYHAFAHLITPNNDNESQDTLDGISVTIFLLAWCMMQGWLYYKSLQGRKEEMDKIGGDLQELENFHQATMENENYISVIRSDFDHVKNNDIPQFIFKGQKKCEDSVENTAKHKEIFGFKYAIEQWENDLQKKNRIFGKNDQTAKSDPFLQQY